MRNPFENPGHALPVDGCAAAFATGAEPAKDVKTDPTPCLAAVSAADDDKILSVCGELLDHDRLAKADRIKALIARGGVYRAQGHTARAIADYDDVLRLDPALADIYNARGELWRKKGHPPRRWPILPWRSS